MEKNIEYKKLIDAHSPKSSTLKNSFFAFVFGGFICAFAQTFVYFIAPYIEKEKAYLLATLSLIVILVLGIEEFELLDSLELSSLILDEEVIDESELLLRLSLELLDIILELDSKLLLEDSTSLLNTLDEVV